MANENTINEKLLISRLTGAKGTPIRMHRALRSLNLTASMWATIILLPALVSFLLWANLEPITNLWATVFDFWIWKLKLGGHVSYLGMSFFGQSLYIPYPDLPVTNPSQFAVWLNLLISVLLLAVSALLSKGYLPLIYIIRAALMVQMSASIYFFIVPEGLPYALSNYIAGMLIVGLYITFLVSPILAFIYYVFDFGLVRKLIVTALMVSYFVVVLPFQYMVHAMIFSSWSMLFMPVMYLLFGALLNVLFLVSWYSWAMTWRGDDNQA